MSLASDLLSVLGHFRSHVAAQVNSGVLVTLDDHIAQIAEVVDHDVAAAEDKAKAIVGALYDALHGAPAAPAAAPAPAAPAAPAEAAPAPGPVDPNGLTAQAEAVPVSEDAVMPNPTEGAEPAAEAPAS